MSAIPHLRLVDIETGEVQDSPSSCPHCAEAQAEAEVWEREVLKLKRDLKRLTEDRDAKLRNDKDYPDAEDLFDEWRRECGHSNARFDFNRIRLAITAIRRYRKDRDKLSWVIQYGKHLAYVDGRGVKHDRFGLLFQDAEHVEKYANAWARARRRGVA